MRLLFIGILACFPALAQPICVYVADTIYSGAGGVAVTSGTIDDSFAYTTASNGATVVQGVGRITVTLGVVPSTCFVGGTTHTMIYTMRRTGGLTGTIAYTRYWTIPASGGPYKISQIEGTTAATPSTSVAPSQITPGTSGQCFITTAGVSAWGSCTGGSGSAGPTGATGPAGPTGSAGSNGAAGSTGPAGSAGANGSAGATGSTGPTGSAGTNGSNGATGAAGATGTAGTNGAAGSTGPTGVTGATGTNGTNGATGAVGATGAAGTNGTDYIFTAIPPIARYIAAAQQALDGATVSTWTDSSGAARNATVHTGTPIMNRKTTNGIPAIWFNGASWYDIPASVTTNTRSSTICVVVEANNNDIYSTAGWLNLGADFGDYYYLQASGSGYVAYQLTHSGATLTGLGLHEAGPEPLCFVNDVASTTAYRDDASFTSAALAAATGTGGQIGALKALGQYYWAGNIYEIDIFPSALSPANVRSWFEYSRSTYHTKQFGNQYYNVCDAGDSITAGANSTRENGRPNQTFPSWANGQFIWAERNLGLGGQTMQAVSIASVASVTACFQSNYQTNLLTIAYGYNDLYGNARTAVQLESDLTAYISAVKAAQAGWKILVATVTPGAANASAETQRGAYNTWLTTTANPGGADGIVDITQDAIMSAYPANSAYYTVPHPNDSGYARLAAIFYQRIRNFVGR
jgi:lysophospholipase L1-like esterase